MFLSHPAPRYSTYASGYKTGMFSEINVVYLPCLLTSTNRSTTLIASSLTSWPLDLNGLEIVLTVSSPGPLGRVYLALSSHGQYTHHIWSNSNHPFLSMDLHEDPEKNVVTAVFELPGTRKEDVNLDVHNGRLTVSAESKTSEEHTEHGYAIRERRSGKYSRTLQLPQGIKVCVDSCLAQAVCL
jgi:hypothetical protein